MKKLRVALIYNAYTDAQPDDRSDTGSLHYLRQMIRGIARGLRRLRHEVVVMPLAGDLMLNTRAQELVKNESGEVVGVIAVQQGEKLLVKARKAVIMATGGFGANETLRKAHLPCPFHYPVFPLRKGTV